MKIWEMYATSLMYVLLCSRFLENDVADLAVDAYLSPASLWRKNIIHSSWVMMVDGPLENFSRCWMLFSAVIRNLVKWSLTKKGEGRYWKRKLTKWLLLFNIPLPQGFCSGQSWYRDDMTDNTNNERNCHITQCFFVTKHEDKLNELIFSLIKEVMARWRWRGQN